MAAVKMSRTSDEAAEKREKIIIKKGLFLFFPLAVLEVEPFARLPRHFIFLLCIPSDRSEDVVNFTLSTS